MGSARRRKAAPDVQAVRSSLRAISEMARVAADKVQDLDAERAEWVFDVEHDLRAFLCEQTGAYYGVLAEWHNYEEVRP